MQVATLTGTRAGKPKTAWRLLQDEVQVVGEDDYVDRQRTQLAPRPEPNEWETGKPSAFSLRRAGDILVVTLDSPAGSQSANAAPARAPASTIVLRPATDDEAAAAERALAHHPTLDAACTKAAICFRESVTAMSTSHDERAMAPGTSLRACEEVRVGYANLFGQLGRSLPEACVPDPPSLSPSGWPVREQPVAAPHTRWRANFSHSNAWDYSLAAVGTVALGVELIGLNSVRPPLRWTDPILFDNAVRAAIHTPNAANAEVNAAWTLWGLQVAYPLVVDVPFVYAHGDRQLARDLFWQDAATLTIAGGVDLAIRDLTGRARPETYDCLKAGGTNCLDSPEATRSFPGGHTANSTAASVLTCTQHLSLHLYGGPWDGLTCALTVASDLTLATFRIMSDNHWTSDQISGIALGTLIGWGVPYFTHLRHHATAGDGNPAAPSKSTALVVPMPMTLDRGGGLGVMGFF